MTNSTSNAELFAAAETTGKKMELTYSGALPPAAAHALHTNGAAEIIDVRTSAELTYVGYVPGSKAVEWQSFPDMAVNSRFIEQLHEQVPTDTPVLFLCRSGVRSHYAAAAAAAAGYRAYNILEGFEGDCDANRHRNTVNGWRAGGLPWIQS